MWSHAPDGYACPFCLADLETAEHPVIVLQRYEHMVVKMQRYWRPGCAGGAVVFPIAHYENVFDLPVELGVELQRAIRETAFAMKLALGSDGISVRQNNEPAGGQDIWHFHVHVFPRFEGQVLDGTEWVRADPEEMRRLDDQLVAYWPS